MGKYDRLANRFQPTYGVYKKIWGWKLLVRLISFLMSNINSIPDCFPGESRLYVFLNFHAPFGMVPLM